MNMKFIKKIAPICRKKISIYVSTYILFIFYDKPRGFLNITLWYYSYLSAAKEQI